MGSDALYDHGNKARLQPMSEFSDWPMSAIQNEMTAIELTALRVLAYPEVLGSSPMDDRGFPK
jgi:hypothetical protein